LQKIGEKRRNPDNINFLSLFLKRAGRPDNDTFSRCVIINCTQARLREMQIEAEMRPVLY
jgi:hypothetical protein